MGKILKISIFDLRVILYTISLGSSNCSEQKIVKKLIFTKQRIMYVLGQFLLLKTILTTKKSKNDIFRPKPKDFSFDHILSFFQKTPFLPFRDPWKSVIKISNQANPKAERRYDPVLLPCRFLEKLDKLMLLFQTTRNRDFGLIRGEPLKMAKN